MSDRGKEKMLYDNAARILGMERQSQETTPHSCA